MSRFPSERRLVLGGAVPRPIQAGWKLRGRWLAPALCFWWTLVASGCGFRVTNERPTFAQLEPHEQSVVETVLAELRGFNAQVEKRTPLSIDAIIDRERINVSFDGHIFFGNLGDGVIHVAPWENLSAGQRTLVKTWFGATSDDATKELYQRFFYRFIAVGQGAKQFMYEALTADWVYAHRSLFNVERDTIRNALSYFQTVGRRNEMWGLTETICRPLLTRYESTYGPTFDKKYLLANLQELANPEAPTGYLYYVCRWIEMGKVDVVDLSTELAWVQQLPTLANAAN